LPHLQYRATVPPVPARSLRGSSRTFLLLAMLICSALVAGCQQKKEPPKTPPPPEVFFVTPKTETVRQHEEFSGRTTSSQTVEIHARVSGHLTKVSFQDGDLVNAGDVLFEIEDDSYKASLAAAKAQVKQAQATLSKLQSQLRRSEKLIATKTITQEEFETLEFQTAEAKAAKESAEAQKDLAEINVNYTKVHAPISGRINRRQVDEGNLVKADSTLLATVVAPSPVYGYFDFDERTLLQMRRLVEQRRMKAAPDFEADVKVALAGEDEFTLHGKINWVDNQIDPGTGTLRARVSIENPSIDDFPSDKSNAEQPDSDQPMRDESHKLVSPGMFIRLSVPVGPIEPAMLIPEEALGSDQGQRYVFLINSENKIEYRSVEVGWLTQGRRVIRNGLKINDRVVVKGLQRVRPGTEVTAKPYLDESKADPAKSTISTPAEKTKLSGESAPAMAIPTPETNDALKVAPVASEPAAEEPAPNEPARESPAAEAPATKSAQKH